MSTEQINPQQQNSSTPASGSLSSKPHASDSPDNQYQPQPQVFTFSTKTADGVSGPTLQLTSLHAYTEPKSVHHWVSTFRLIARLSDWTQERSKDMLLLLLAPDIQKSLTPQQKIDSCLDSILALFFPVADQHRYINQLRSLRSTQYSSISAYTQAVEDLLQFLDYCYPPQEKL